MGWNEWVVEARKLSDEALKVALGRLIRKGLGFTPQAVWIRRELKGRG